VIEPVHEKLHLLPDKSPQMPRIRRRAEIPAGQSWKHHHRLFTPRAGGLVRRFLSQKRHHPIVRHDGAKRVVFKRPADRLRILGEMNLESFAAFAKEFAQKFPASNVAGGNQQMFRRRSLTEWSFHTPTLGADPSSDHRHPPHREKSPRRGIIGLK
jgi:hypothetical protein